MNIHRLYVRTEGVICMALKHGSKKALLVIDMLNDFILPEAPLRVPSAAGIIPFLQEKLKEMRSQRLPVIYICDAHDTDDQEFEYWPPHAMEGTRGAEVIDSLAPEPGEVIIKKKRYSGFYQSGLDRTLKSLGVGHLMVTGVVSNICVLYTVADARSRGYQVSVLRDGVAGLDPGDHAFALKQMQEVLHAEIV